MIKNAILPGNIDTSHHFWGTFGRCEPEIAARLLVKLFKSRNPGAWDPIPEGLLDFYLSGLECEKFLLVVDGMLSVTDEFVRRVSKFATIEFRPRRLAGLRDEFWKLVNPL